MVERGAIVIKGGDRLNERRWRKWEQFENGLRTAFGQEPRIPSWKNVVSRRQFSRQRGRPRTYVPVSCGQKPLPPSLPPLLFFYDFLRSRPSSTAEFFSHNGRSDLAAFSFFSMKISLLPSPHCLPRAFKIPRLQGAPFMPIALDKVFKAR